MTTVEIKEIKSDTPVINDSKDLPENIKNLVGKDSGLTNETEVIGDVLDKDKIVKKVSISNGMINASVLRTELRMYIQEGSFGLGDDRLNENKFTNKNSL